MALITYDPVNGVGHGSIFFSSLTGTTTIDIWENITLDLSSVPYFNDSGQLSLTGWISPFITITSPLPTYSFTAVPDTRYKFGSYSFNTGYTIEFTSEGEPIPTPIRGTPNYIIYPTQILEISRFALPYPNANVLLYEVVFEANPPTATELFIINPRLGSGNSPSNYICSSLSLNLTAETIADIKIFYTFTTTFVDNFARDEELLVILF